MSHFHQYSRRNILLIKLQMPNATKVASFKMWKEKFNRPVKRNEKGLYIYAPIGGKKPETKLFEKLDPETKAPMLDADGKVVMEELTTLGSPPKFKLVPVFDISQTYGEPLPELVENLSGNVAHYEMLIDALKAASPLPIVFEPMNPDQDGYCRFGEKIAIRKDMSEPQTIATIVHEITHAKLHDINIIAESKSNEVKEIESESIAYVVCQRLGIETGANSFGYLASWSNHDPEMKEFKASIDIIRTEAGALIESIEGQLQVICNERGINITENVSSAPTQTDISEPESDSVNTDGNTFSIYQVKEGDEYRNFRFVSTKELETFGATIDYTNYDLVYTAPLAEHVDIISDPYPALNSIYNSFN